MKTIWKKFSEARPPVDHEIYIRTLSSSPILAFIPSGSSGQYQEVGTSQCKQLSPAYQWCNVEDLHEIEISSGISIDDLYYAVKADDHIGLFINDEPADINMFFFVIQSWMRDEDKYKQTGLSASYHSDLLNELLEEKGDDVTIEEVEKVQSYAFRQLTNFLGKIQEKIFPSETGSPDPYSVLGFAGDDFE
jgi:hypothetical protein